MNYENKNIEHGDFNEDPCLLGPMRAPEEPEAHDAGNPDSELTERRSTR
jgi:hypothetical protein